MKKFNMFFAAAVLASAFGCEKIDTDPASIVGEGETCTLSVSFAGTGVPTKLVGQDPANESTIQNVQVFVFRKDQGGVLDASVSAGFNSPLNYDASSAAYAGIELGCTAGEREVWAVVNAAADHTADGSVADRADLLALTSMLSENTESGLFMTGSKTATLNAGAASVTLEVRRACAAVVLKSVTNRIESQEQSENFRVKDVYLINVPAKVNYGLTERYADAADWYARMGKESDSGKSLLILDKSEPVALVYGASDNTEHRFYSYPNGWAPSTASEWSPRATSLVVEAEYKVGGEWLECYYPVILHNGASGLESNRLYTVEITVSRPGSDNPNVPVTFDTLSGTIEVLDWETGAEYTETI